MADREFRRASVARETWSVEDFFPQRIAETKQIMQEFKSRYTSLWNGPVVWIEPEVEKLASEPDCISQTIAEINMAEIVYSLLNKTLKQWGSIPIRGFNQTTITSKFKPGDEEVLRGMASRLTKKSQKLEILPAKHQPVVGSTDFSSRPSGGGQSSPDTCGDGLPTQGHASAATAGTIELPSPAFNNKSSVADHVIEVNNQGHDSAVTAGSSELASPALNNTPSASDQSTRASSLLENRDDDEQPPPDRSASDIERGEARPAERRLNPSSVAKTCLFVSCEVCIAPSQIRYNASTSLSPNANILLLFAEVIGVAGFLLCLGACFFQRKHRTSGVMTVMGCVATICGLLSILGTRFPEKAMLWLTAALFGLPIAASPFALKELV